MPARTNQVESLLDAASRSRAQGDREAARVVLTQAAEIAPADPRVQNALGMLALGARDYDLAARHFDAAVAADPTAGPLWVNLATAHRGRRDDRGEEAALIAATRVNQLDFIAHTRLAELYDRLDDGRSAAIHWSAVVQMAAAMPEQSPQVLEVMRRGQSFLASHNNDLGDRVQQHLGAELDAMGAGSRRIRACIDAALGRRRIFTNQCEGIHFPFLPVDEYFDRSLFPWFDALEARTDAIRSEALRLLTQTPDAIRPYVRQDAGTPDNKWTPLDHNLAWGACFLWEFGTANDEVCRLCPETAAALSQVPQNHVPGKAPTAFFSVLQPHSHIPPHTGVTNTRAIVHLPLVVPPGCQFRVGGETRAWVEGQAFAFDDTIDHEAWNPSDQTRIVLIFDVWNPHLTEPERRLISEFYALADRG
jgi:aspartyl/asparaginyl beta-hydroxylase (cupin superfamily)